MSLSNQSEDSLYAIFGRILRFHYCRMHMLLEKEGIYPGQPPLFFILGKHDGLSQKELAEKLFIKPATITIMLKRMEKALIIERRPDIHDQRVSRVYLTEHGKQVYYRVLEVLRTIQDEVFGNFSPEDNLVLRRLFNQILINLKESCEKKLAN